MTIKQITPLRFTPARRGPLYIYYDFCWDLNNLHNSKKCRSYKTYKTQITLNKNAFKFNFYRRLNNINILVKSRVVIVLLAY